MMLLRYWKPHGQPRVMRTVPGLPANDVFIEARGREAIRIGSTPIRLERYVIDGVVWGRETVWLDEHGALAAAITRAGGLSFEAVREDLEPALVGFVAAGDARSHRRSRGDHAARAAAQERHLRDDRRDDCRRHRPCRRFPTASSSCATGGSPTSGPRAAVDDSGRRAVGCRGRQDDRARAVGHAHARHADRVGAGLPGGRRDDGPRHGERVRIRRRRCATRSRRGARSARACSPPGLIDGGGPNAFGVYYAATPEEAKQAVGEVSRRRLSADQDLQPRDAADRRGDLRRSAPPRHDGHRPRAQRHDDRAGRSRRHGSHRAPRHPRRSGIRRGAEDDRVPARSQDGDRSDAVVERAARPRGRARRSPRFSLAC